MRTVGGGGGVDRVILTVAWHELYTLRDRNGMKWKKGSVISP